MGSITIDDVAEAIVKLRRQVRDILASSADAVNASQSAIKKIQTQISNLTISAISGLADALAAKQDALGFTAENVANRGVADGYAPLDASAKVPAANLPSYVDDVIEVADFASLPSPGETGKIYVTIDTNAVYRWSGSTYIEIGSSPGSTDSVAEGSTNLYFTAARVLATVLTGFTAATATAVVATDTVLAAIGKLQGQINGLTTTAISEGTNLYFTSGRVLASVLTGLSTATATAVVATDTVLGAFGKVQGQINAIIANGWVTTARIADANVTYAKMQDISATALILGRKSTGAGDPEELTGNDVAAILGSWVVPTGAMMMWPVNTPPTGWLERDGSAISRTTYAALFVIIGTTFGVGDGSTTFNLPDDRGYFLRGWDHGAGRDSGRAFGSTQTDAMQGHFHAPKSATAFLTHRSGTGTDQTTAGTNNGQDTSTGSPVSDGTNGTPRTASETRPMNRAYLPIIKY